LPKREWPLCADFVAEVGDGKNEVTVSMSLSRLLRLS
jgi:hypothetical protein